MFYRISGICLLPDEEKSKLRKKAAKELGVPENCIQKLKLYRSSLDARRGNVVYRHTVDVYLDKASKPRLSEKCKAVENEFVYPIPTLGLGKNRPLVVGFGPAGIFAALLLARAGMKPVIIERGKKVEERARDVAAFFSGQGLNTESNIQFGEGGAGTFSDGKLNTLLKDKNHRGRFVLNELVKAGAPEEIFYLNKPHVGTDKLRLAVKSLREEILSLGGTFYFESRFLCPIAEKGRLVGARILFPDGEREIACDTIFLGIGHSARDTFQKLRACGLEMEKKIFSVGVRIEHLQSDINLSQYGNAPERYRLPAADYKLAVPTSCGKTLYTFCMCPGGTVVPAASQEGGVAVNGMSDFARDGRNANSALLLNVLPEEVGEDLFDGFRFQRQLEEKAFRAAGGDWKAPCQLVGDFLKNSESAFFGKVEPTYPIGVTKTKIDDILPKEYCAALREGLGKMGTLLAGFDDPEAILTGVESRATCPVRILRGENYQSSLRGLYPIGEGAGYAGGIMSSAMDGMKAVEAYFKTLKGECN